MSDSTFPGVALFGAPGVGKGTQGQILGNIPGFFHLSSGDVFRSIDISSDLGKQVDSFISRGELVPDELTLKIWKKGLDGQIATSRYKPNEDLLVLDGIPRNCNQVGLLNDYINILLVIHLVCNDEEAMIHRIKRRAIRENRTDDGNEEVIRHRFKVYHEQTASVLASYPAAIVKEVNALASPAEVLHSVLDFLIPVQNQHFRSQMDE